MEVYAIRFFLMIGFIWVRVNLKVPSTMYTPFILKTQFRIDSLLHYQWTLIRASYEISLQPSMFWWLSCFIRMLKCLRKII